MQNRSTAPLLETICNIGEKLFHNYQNLFCNKYIFKSYMYGNTMHATNLQFKVNCFQQNYLLENFVGWFESA